LSALVFTHGADQQGLVAQLPGMSRKIERSTAGMLDVADHIPQNLADADDLHLQIMAIINFGNVGNPSC
jgi:hypothetical protein